MHRSVTLNSFARGEDAALLALRFAVGAFLIYGVWDNIIDAARMQEFVIFLRQSRFPAPEWMAPVSVWVQFFAGVSFVLGIFVRWGGLLCALNFLVALVMVDRFAGVRGAFPALCLMLIGVYLATRGGGRFAIDRLFDSRSSSRL